MRGRETFLETEDFPMTDQELKLRYDHWIERGEAVGRLLLRLRKLIAPNAKHRHPIVDSQSSPPAPGHGEEASESLAPGPM